MGTPERQDRIRRAKGIGVMRALHESELEAAGTARTEALRRAEHELDRIARLLPDAVAAGVTMTRIGRLTGVSRPTLYELRARYSDSPRDLRIAVLQGLMSYETSFPGELAKHLGRPSQEISPVIDDFIERGWIEWDLDERRARFETDAATGEPIECGEECPLGLTPDGYDALEAWTFEHESHLDDQGNVGA